MKTVKKQYSIKVCYRGKNYGEPGKYICTIKRVLQSEQIGNFNPLFCQYKNKRYLVCSLAGDLSDPFRRIEEYAETFYIEID